MELSSLLRHCGVNRAGLSRRRRDDPLSSGAPSRSLARSLPLDSIEDPYRRAESLASIARVQTLIRRILRRPHDSPGARRRRADPRAGLSRLGAERCRARADCGRGSDRRARDSESHRGEAAAGRGARADRDSRSCVPATSRARSKRPTTIREREAKSEILRQIVAIAAARGELTDGTRHAARHRRSVLPSARRGRHRGRRSPHGSQRSRQRDGLARAPRRPCRQV